MTVAQNQCAQAAAAFKKLFRARRNRPVHPVTGPTFLCATKPNALNFELLPDQLIQIDTRSDGITADKARRTIPKFHRATKLIENLKSEKRDLTFVTFLVVEKTVSANTVTGHAVDRWNFNNWMIVRFTSMMAEKVVAGRNIKTTDFHQGNVNQ